MLESSWVGWRRDLRFLLGGLVGEAPRPFTPRKRAPRPLEGREVIVSRVERPAVDSVTLHLSDATGAPIAYRAGEFFTLLVEVGGELLRRAYSASSAPADGPGVSVTVRRVEGGRVSNALVDGAHVGQRLRLLGPSGSFVPPADREQLVLIAGGSGVTPIVSIVRDRLGRPGDATQLVVLYGHRREELAAFASELTALAEAHPERLRLRLVFEEPGGALDHRTGRLDAPTVRALLDELGLFDPGVGVRRAYLLCGPLGMMNEARAALLSAGASLGDVLEERFASPASASARALPTEAQPLVVERAGRVRALAVAPGKTLLEAATDAGVELPYSCTMGGCGACRVRLLEGEVSQSEPSCLSDEERARGDVLACVARPLGPCRVEVP